MTVADYKKDINYVKKRRKKEKAPTLELERAEQVRQEKLKFQKASLERAEIERQERIKLEHNEDSFERTQLREEEQNREAEERRK